MDVVPLTRKTIVHYQWRTIGCCSADTQDDSTLSVKYYWMLFRWHAGRQYIISEVLLDVVPLTRKTTVHYQWRTTWSCFADRQDSAISVKNYWIWGRIRHISRSFKRRDVDCDWREIYVIFSLEEQTEVRNPIRMSHNSHRTCGTFLDGLKSFSGPQFHAWKKNIIFTVSSPCAALVTSRIRFRFSF
jgi:hypothetical protein